MMAFCMATTCAPCSPNLGWPGAVFADGAATADADVAALADTGIDIKPIESAVAVIAMRLMSCLWC